MSITAPLRQYRPSGKEKLNIQLLAGRNYTKTVGFRGTAYGIAEGLLTGAEGGSRTHTPLRTLRPERSASTVPPLRHILMEKAQSGPLVLRSSLGRGQLADLYADSKSTECPPA